MNHLNPEEAQQKLGQTNVLFLDVRTPFEYRYRRITQAVNIPLDELVQRHIELNAENEIIVLCEHGIRSQQAAGILLQLGFERIYNMVGGMSRWTADVVSG